MSLSVNLNFLTCFLIVLRSILYIFNQSLFLPSYLFEAPVEPSWMTTLSIISIFASL